MAAIIRFVTANKRLLLVVSYSFATVPSWLNHLWMAISIDQFKEFFRHHAAGVSLVTVFSDDRTPFGFTASSLASLSADPALATVNLAKNTSTAKVLKPGSKVAVHTLSADNFELAAELSGPRENRFTHSGWNFEGNSPTNREASAILLGEVLEILDFEGSQIVVISGDAATFNQYPDLPLVYFNRQYLQAGELATQTLHKS